MIRKSLRLNLLVAAATVAVVIGNAAYSVNQDYRSTIADHEVMVRDLASVVADQTMRSIQDTDLILRQIGEVIKSDGGLQKMTQQRQWDALHRMAQRIHGIVAILLADPSGNVVVNSATQDAPPNSVADRDYMTVLADHDVLHIGSAVHSRIQQNEIVYTINRRLSDSLGNYIGVASAGISTSHLTDFYDLLGFKKNPLIAVYRADGDMIARRQNLKDLIGKNIANTSLFQVYIKQAPEGVYRANSPVDGLDRLVAYKMIKHTGMVVVVGISWDVITAEWHQRALRTGGITLVSAIVILLAAWWNIAATRSATRAQSDRDEALNAHETTHKALQHAMRDHLTGLPTRALFLQEAERLRSDCQDGNARMAVMIIDLDGFKGVNDTLGHETGDEVLVRAADVLQSALRETDVAGRLGGDEFGVCIAAPTEHIRERANLISGRIVERMAEIGMGVGCSVGVTICQVSCEELPCALRKADEAMYEAKQRGKNQFVVWGESRQNGAKWQAAHQSCSC